MTAFNQNFNTYPGDVISPVFTMLDQSGNPINISSASAIAWSAYRTVGAAPAVSKSLGAGTIVFVGGGTTGQFQVNLLAGDTNAMTGVYLHGAVITDALGNVSTVALGQMTVGRSPSWTYDPTQLGTTAGTGTPLHQVRRLIGDVKYSDQQMWDEEINFALAQRGYNPASPATSGVIYAAAADCCRNLSAELARQVDIVQGELKTNYSNRAKAYMLLSRRYEFFASVRGLGVVYGGGLSIADKQAQESNTDRVSPNFTIGMMDNFILGGGGGPQTETLDEGSDDNAELPDF
jgi:hypothetical protein